MNYDVNFLLNLIQLIAIISGGLWFLTRVTTKISLIIQKMDFMEKSIEGIGMTAKVAAEALGSLARHDERLLAVERRLEDQSRRITDATLAITSKISNVPKN